MKTILAIILSNLALSVIAFAHGEVEVGPHGGRILEFSKNKTIHGEVIVKDGKFHVALLDKSMKPIDLLAQQLTATVANKLHPEKLLVEKVGPEFVVPLVKEDAWVVFQFRTDTNAKPITARLHYETHLCGECKKPEWLCVCAAEKSKATQPSAK